MRNRPVPQDGGPESVRTKARDSPAAQTHCQPPTPKPQLMSGAPGGQSRVAEGGGKAGRGGVSGRASRSDVIFILRMQRDGI